MKGWKVEVLEGGSYPIRYSSRGGDGAPLGEHAKTLRAGDILSYRLKRDAIGGVDALRMYGIEARLLPRD